MAPKSFDNHVLSRREVIRALAAVTSGAALLPLLSSWSRAAEAPSTHPPTKPTGNPAVDKSIDDFLSAPLETTRLTPSLAMLSGPGGNIAVLAGPAGTLLVDTGIQPAAPAVAKAVEAFAHRRVSWVVNTHWHFDHTGGNEYFGQRGARIVAHDDTRASMSHPQAIELMNYTFPASPPAALPVVTFPDKLTLYHGDETLHLYHVLPAHTDGDILVHFTKENVLHTGDVFFNGFYPFIDYSTEGWIGGMVEAEDRALALCNALTQVIPGHGKLGTPAELKAAREMLATVQGRIEKLLDDGKSVNEIVAAVPTADFDTKWGHGPSPADHFTRDAADSIQRHRQKSQ